MSWIFEFLDQYVNTPTYLHTMSDNATFYLIIGLAATVIVVGGYGLVKLIEWLTDRRG